VAGKFTYIISKKKNKKTDETGRRKCQLKILNCEVVAIVNVTRMYFPNLL